jgi:phage shock protein PspC (stress-responsive transcriptional regulator)
MAVTYALSVSPGACAELEFTHFADVNGSVYMPFSQITLTHSISSLDFMATSEYSYLTKATNDDGISAFCGCDLSGSPCKVGGNFCSSVSFYPSYSFIYEVTNLACFTGRGHMCGCAYAEVLPQLISIDYCNDIDYSAGNSLQIAIGNSVSGTSSTFSENLGYLNLLGQNFNATLYQDGVFEFPDPGILDTFVVGNGADIHILSVANDLGSYDNTLAGWYKSSNSSGFVYSQTDFTSANPVTPLGCHPPTVGIAEGSVDTASELDQTNIIQNWLTNGYSISSYQLDPLLLTLSFDSGIQVQYTVSATATSVTFVQSEAIAAAKSGFLSHICQSDSYSGNVSVINSGTDGQVFVHVGNVGEDYVVASLQIPFGPSTITIGGQLANFTGVSICVYSSEISCVTPTIVCQNEQFPSANSDRIITGTGGGVGEFVKSNWEVIFIILIVVGILFLLCLCTFGCLACFRRP